ncbi:MAG: glucose-6-phosphate isomerase, partial [Chthoniobacterales bacterium]
MTANSQWPRFQKYFIEQADTGVSLDISRMNFGDDFFEQMRPRVEKAFAAMEELERGAIANPDEQRMVGHYWLRDAALAPEELQADVTETNRRIKEFAAAVHAGKIATAADDRFRHILLIGIGGSALGPQFVADALGTAHDPMQLHFFDNTDPDGFDRL